MKQGLTNCENRPMVAGRIGLATPRATDGLSEPEPFAPAAQAGAGDQVFLPLAYESGYDYPLLVWLPDSRDDRFDLGRVMSRLSLRNYLAVRASGTTPETCWAAIERMTDRYSVHPRRIYLVGEGDGGDELPDVQPPVVTIQTEYRGASAEIVDTQITQKLEDFVGGT
ncbi:MAG: efflux RND transporter permease subunit, partial [Planctomycetia bacterium]|nr:efflux RND transporter permease subunit [Planctomycetia bacterium]